MKEIIFWKAKLLHIILIAIHWIIFLTHQILNILTLEIRIKGKINYNIQILILIPKQIKVMQEAERKVVNTI